MRRPWAIGGLFAIVATATAAQGADDTVFKTRLLKSASGEPSIEVSFTLPEVRTGYAESGMVEVAAGALERVHVAGAPDVPTAGMIVAVPDGYEPRLVVQRSRGKAIDGVVARPFQPKFRCGGGAESSNYQYDSSIYEGNDLWPRENVRLEYLGQLQGARLARVAVYPVQVDPLSKSLAVTSSLDLRVDFVKTSRDAKPVALSPTMHSLLRASTVNAEASRNFEAAATPETMLIVVADQFHNEISEFVAWKRRRGLVVDVVKFSEAGGNTNALKTYVQNYYDQHNPKPTYLLLVGNGTAIPPFRRSTSSGSAASDYPFTLLAGGTSDIVPDMIVGRVVADDAAGVRNQIGKWLAHERAPDAGTAADWYAQGTTIASSEGSGPSDVEYAQQVETSLKGATYRGIDRFYEGSGTATATNIVNGLNAGRSWLTYFGHGSGTSWGSTNTTFSTSTIRTLTNQKLPVIVDVACDNGSFVDVSNCFGKVWVNHMANGKGAGAVGYYGGSVSISWDPPAVMAVGVAKRHFERNLVAYGASLLAGQLYLMEQMGSGADVVDNFEWYILFGDPSLTMRTAPPAAFDVTYAVVDGERAREFNVNVANADGSARGGVSVALLSADGYSLLGYGQSGADGRIVFELSTDAALAGARLTAGGYNLVTREVVVQ